MEMEFMTEFTSFDRARGKRTKRPKPNLPAVSDHCLIDNFPHDQLSSSEEDEDMANCLIMLAQSDCASPINEEHSNSIPDHQIRQKTEKLSSLRGGYECKTCNRTFPSFQALGGHRASHKKPKLNFEDKKSNSVSIEDHHHEEEEEEKLVEDLITVNDLKSTKIHECSICGSEFLSGQALGGHMRKHRPIPPSINRNSIITDDVIENSKNMLSLDLNFPPPEIVEDVKSKFQFTENASQQRLVFSAPALVDCHN
ncbi:zinc finger protein ZAT11 [Rutidosis leptorrhynchoides]|uniref:zinc finger protein ZAT11 n=1 Tax=Rutidosis leptorrhynchoides TaxID=125765 RepID=UPI003A98D84E